MAVETAYYDDGMTCWGDGEMQGFELPDPADDFLDDTSPEEESYQVSTYTEQPVAADDAALLSSRWIIPLVLSYTPRGAVGPALVAGCAGKQTVDTASTDSPNNSNDSSIQGDTSSVGCEDSAFEDIQDAVDFAADGDTVEVCDGTYGSFSVDKSLTIRAKSGHSPKIDAGGEIGIQGGAGSSQITLDGFEVFSASIGLSLNGDNFLLSNLDVHNNSDRGLYVFSGSNSPPSIIIDDSSFHHNTESGADFYLSTQNNSGTIEISNVEIYNNGSSGLNIIGGTFGVDRFDVTASSLDVYDNGDPTSTLGGGIYLETANVSINSSTITGNSAFEGGGIYVYGASLILQNTAVQNNVASENDVTPSGGLHISSSSGDVTSYNTDWNGTNEPYDVSVKYVEVYDFGNNANFQCESDVGCSDL